ncbi:TraR/DksA C4-type zinc finger protein [Geomonas sp. RF6]|uniref:TraR/DksA family transcriptional regulator n=1 Tax=Geomonas sp. RF6 TaxID=2897342 RepID=UPI001E2C09EC|nr:TraR/DksA C4-type zinc finger protein [Geomonas sp. RF6]UFS69878.1 TraR/DksA C4-type zinc finger protein [Geomonas sp. RF6]
MSQEQDAEELKNLLLERKRRLWAELREEVFHNRAEDLSSQYDIPQDNGEASMLSELTDEGLGVADVRREELTKLEEAERKLEEGTYGICQECGEPIGIARLNVMPYATHCVQCQSEQEEKPPASKI